MTAALPVQHGTAEMLARLIHFRALEDVLPDAHELDPVIRFLVGRVDDAHELVAELIDELNQLWSLVTEDFDDDQLDELTDDDWARHSFATQQQEIDHRHSATVARLVGDIEGYIWLHRVVHVEWARIVRTAVACDAARQEQEQRAAVGQANAPGHPFADILAGTVDTRHRVNDGDINEYLRQKAELA